MGELLVLVSGQPVNSPRFVRLVHARSSSRLLTGFPASTVGQNHTMRIRAKIEGTGKTAAGFHIPDDVVAALGTSRKPAVKATINGYTYRSSIASMGGEFWLGV